MFDANNNKLRPHEAISDQPYFVDRAYEQSCELFKNHHAKLRADFQVIVLDGSAQNLHSSTLNQCASSSLETDGNVEIT